MANYGEQCLIIWPCIGSQATVYASTRDINTSVPLPTHTKLRQCPYMQHNIASKKQGIQLHKHIIIE